METYGRTRPPCPRCGSRDTFDLDIVLLPNHIFWFCENCELVFNPQKVKFNWRRVIPYCPYCDKPFETDDGETWFCWGCRVFASYNMKEKRWEIKMPEDEPTPPYCYICGKRLYYVEVEGLWECSRCGAAHTFYPNE